MDNRCMSKIDVEIVSFSKWIVGVPAFEVVAIHSNVSE